jgi:Fungal specific transcription factor domain
MHALLALGASHLTRVSSQSDYSTTAIVHRGQAIKGLNEALAKGTREYGESDAMLAACYALTFQASCMGDGMTDFLTMVRGCALVTEQIHKDQSHTAFNLEKDTHLRVMEPRFDHLPTLDPSLVLPATISLEALRPLLRRSMDQHFHNALLLVVLGLRESSKAAYLNFIRVYDTFFDMKHDQFNVFVDVNNITSQLLMAHMICIQMLMVPLILHEWPQRGSSSEAQVLLGMVEWGERIFERTPSNMGMYLEWPKEILNAVRREIEVLSAGTHRSLQLRILDP